MINKINGANDQILHTEASVVTFPLSTEVRQFITDLYKTIKSLPGIPLGLAANQIATSVDFIPSMFLALESFNEDGTPHYKLYINPQIRVVGSVFNSDESCCSVGSKEITIKRVKNVEITYFFIDDQFNPTNIKEKVYGDRNPLSIIIQHEYDHLLGQTIGD